MSYRELHVQLSESLIWSTALQQSGRCNALSKLNHGTPAIFLPMTMRRKSWQYTKEKRLVSRSFRSIRGDASSRRRQANGNLPTDHKMGLNWDLYRSIPLLADTIKPKTKKVYEKALVAFYSCVETRGLCSSSVDRALVEYIQAMHDDDCSPGSCQSAVNTLAALVHTMPHLRPRLPWSRTALKGWGKKLSPRSALPLTKRLVLALVGTLDLMHKRGAAVCLALSWAGYLRAAEALGLRRSDVALSGDPRLGDVSGVAVGVLIKEAKTGPSQFVAIRDPAARHLLESFIQSTAPGWGSAKLFGLTYSKYLDVLKKAVANLGLKHFNITTLSARIGGALYDYLQGHSFGTIAITGRWASAQSVQRYLTNGRALLMTLKFSADQERRIARAVNLAEVLIMASARSVNMTPPKCKGIRCSSK